jgi:predicted small secreted protein
MTRAIFTLPLLASLLMTACGTATPAFRGADVSRHVVGSMTFDVRLRGDRAEAQRRNFGFGQKFPDVAAHAGIAIERASGCTIRRGTLTGDSAIVFARIDC